MSSFSDFPSEIDCDTTRVSPFNDHQWCSAVATLMDIELNAPSNSTGGYSQEEPVNPFSSPHDVTASYGDAVMDFNDTFAPDESTADNQ